jgi:sulfotransferase
MLGLPRFQHDFENVDYQAEDFDLALGARGLHTVRRRVEWVERETILPPELFARFSGDMFWRSEAVAARKVPVIRITG